MEGVTMSPKLLNWTAMVQSIIRNASRSVQSLNMDDLFGASMMNLRLSTIMASDTNPCNFSSFTSPTITLINASYLILLCVFKFISFSFIYYICVCDVVMTMKESENLCFVWFVLQGLGMIYEEWRENFVREKKGEKR